MNQNILSKAVFEPHILRDKELPMIIHCSWLSRRGVFNIHENIELLYILEGSGAVVCGGRTEQVKPGDVVVVNSYTAHQVCPKERMNVFCLIIDHSFCKNHGIDTDKLQFTPLLREESLNCRLDELMEEYLARPEKPFREAAVKSRVLELLVYLCRRHSTPKKEPAFYEDAAFEHIRSAIEYMKKNLGRKVTVDEVADYVGLSKYYFLRIFKRITGYTMINYISLIRCEYAKELLLSGEYTVKEVALRCGFEDFSYFTNVFKKYTGSLPSDLL